MRWCFVLLLIACLCVGLRATRRSSSSSMGSRGSSFSRSSSSTTYSRSSSTRYSRSSSSTRYSRSSSMRSRGSSFSRSSSSSRGSYRSYRSYRPSGYRFRKSPAAGGLPPSIRFLISNLTLEFAARRIEFAAARKAGRSPLALRRKRRTYYRNFVKRLKELRRQMKRRRTRMGGKQPEGRPDPQWFNRRVGVKPLPANMAWLLCRRSGQVGCGGDEGGNRARSGPGNDGKVHARGGVVAPLLVAAESKGNVVLKQSERQAGEGGFSWKRNIARGGQVSRSSFGKGGIIKPAVGLSGRKRLEGEAPIYTTWAQLLRYEAKARAANDSASGLAWNPEMTANGGDGSFDDLFPEEGAGAGPPTTDWTAVSPTPQTGSTKPDVSTGSEGKKEEPKDDSEDEEFMVGSNVSEDEDEAGDDDSEDEEFMVGSNVSEDDIGDEIVAEDDELSSSEDIDDEGDDADDNGDDSGDEPGDETEDSSAGDADYEDEEMSFAGPAMDDDEGFDDDEEDDEEGWISESDVEKTNDEDDVEDELESELTAVQDFVDDEEIGGLEWNGVSSVPRWPQRIGSARGRFRRRKMKKKIKKRMKKKLKLKKKMKKRMKKRMKKKMKKKMKKIARKIKRKQENRSRGYVSDESAENDVWNQRDPLYVQKFRLQTPRNRYELFPDTEDGRSVPSSRQWQPRPIDD